MLNITKTVFLVTLFLATSAANAAAIKSLTLTGGSFTLDNGGVNLINPAAFANMSVDGSYDGAAPSSGGSEASYFSTSIATFTLDSFGPVAIYTAGPFPGITGDVTDGNLSLDLSSLTAWWNGNEFNIGTSGSSITITTYDAVSGDFTTDWSSLAVSGPSAGVIATISITGNAQVVPVPAAAWLFGSGLLGLVGVARRRKMA